MSTDQQKQDDSATARHAERVTPVLVTSETIAAMYAPQAKEAEPEDKSKEESKADTGSDGQQEGKKNRFQERISELVDKRRAAESEAESAKREASELRAKLESLAVRAEPVKEEARPARNQFTDEDEYTDAVAEWKATQVLAKREREHVEAQMQRQQDELANNWKRNQEKAKAEIDDYAEVLGKSDIMLPGHIHQALLESDVGPHLAYYFASNPDEAKRFAAMSPTSALRQLGKLEDRLLEDEAPAPKTETKAKPAPEVSKAPAPVVPIKDGRALDPGPAKSFDEYRTRRAAEKKR